MIPSLAKSGITSASGSWGSITAGNVLLNPYNASDAREIQKRLKGLGYYRGEIDGDWGPASQAALYDFKSQNGLASNELWSGETQRKLFATVR